MAVFSAIVRVGPTSPVTGHDFYRNKRLDRGITEEKQIGSCKPAADIRENDRCLNVAYIVSGAVPGFAEHNRKTGDTLLLIVSVCVWRHLPSREREVNNP